MFSPAKHQQRGTFIQDFSIQDSSNSEASLEQSRKHVSVVLHPQ